MTPLSLSFLVCKWGLLWKLLGLSRRLSELIHFGHLDHVCTVQDLWQAAIVSISGTVSAVLCDKGHQQR